MINFLLFKTYRLETLQNKISDLNEANSKTQNSATELSVLEENISELESQRDALLTLNTTMEEKTKNAEEVGLFITTKNQTDNIF